MSDKEDKRAIDEDNRVLSRLPVISNDISDIDNCNNSILPEQHKVTQPKVCVYTANNPLTVDCISKIKTVIDLFSSKNIMEKDIVVITCNTEQIEKMKQQAKNLEFPQVYIGDNRIGTVEELYEYELSGKLAEFLTHEELLTSSIRLGRAESQQDNSGNDNQTLELGVVDQWINAAEWTIRGMSNGVWSAWQYVRKGSTETLDGSNYKKVDTKTSNTQNPADIEIEVIRTNWLWRNQKRIFRFTTKKFMRLLPETKEIKETFDYGDIQEIILRGKNNIVIMFRNGMEAQYLQSLQCQRIKEIILDRVGPEISIPVVIQK